VTKVAEFLSRCVLWGRFNFHEQPFTNTQAFATFGNSQQSKPRLNGNDRLQGGTLLESEPRVLRAKPFSPEFVDPGMLRFLSRLEPGPSDERCSTPLGLLARRNCDPRACSQAHPQLARRQTAGNAQAFGTSHLAFSGTFQLQRSANRLDRLSADTLIFRDHLCAD
jgi:hypothetical protein